MKCEVRTVFENGITYQALRFICPGCESLGFPGLHMLPVNSKTKDPSWDFDGNLESPTLTPSILTKYNDHICHSYLKDGVFKFLDDCTHELAGKEVPIPDLTW